MPKGKMIQPKKTELKEILIKGTRTIVHNYIDMYGLKDFKENVLKTYFDKKSKLWPTEKSET